MAIGNAKGHRLLATPRLRLFLMALTLLFALGAATPVGQAGGAASHTTRSISCTPPPPPPLHGPIAVKQVLGPGHPGPIVKTPSGFLVSDTSTGIVTRFSADGAIVGTIHLPKDDLQHGLAVDHQGNLYVGRYPWALVKYSPSGSLIWTRPSSFPLVAVFVIGHGDSQTVGLTNWKNSTVQTYTLYGVPSAPLSLSGNSFSSTSSGGLLSTDEGRYVRIFDAQGQQTGFFGDPNHDNDPSPVGAPFHFYQLGGAAQLPDGRLLVTDTKTGIMVISPQGLLLGAIKPTGIDPNGLSERSGILVSDGYVYVEAGARFTNQQHLTQLRLNDLLARATHGEAADPRLGIGVGLTMSNTDLYVEAGAPVRVKAFFDPWWQRLAPSLSLCWTLRSTAQLRHDLPGERGLVPISTLTRAPTGSPLALPRHLQPGAYQIDALLLRSGKAISKTRMVFTVAAPGMRLNFDNLPGGADWGGPQPARGVALAGQLGTSAFRAQLDWTKLLDKGPNAPLDLSTYLPQFQAAAAQASRSSATLIVQVGQGGNEKKLVADGTWQRRIGELVSALKPYVHVWEAWNEPNATFGPASDYVTRVLAPFAQAVRQADPNATVVGGSTVGVDLSYWKGIIAAGGLQWLDVAGVHPYTGHNRSWEENGTVAQLRELRSLLDRNGSHIPIWNTEQAWWSDGPANLLGQADNSARAILWMHALGIGKWAYFIPEGGWGNGGVSFSAIQIGNYVKPAALAIMTAEDQLAGRTFLGEVPLGLDSSYALRFGPRKNDPRSGELLVAWTDALQLPVVITGRKQETVTTTHELGAVETEIFSGHKVLSLDSDPVYLSLHGPGSLAITPRESFGRDLALASAGATATASSASPSNPASAAIDGINGASGGGDLPGLPMWVSAPGDQQPRLLIMLRAPKVIDRILVATHSIGSIVPGLRDYDVQIRRSAAGAWRTIRKVRGQFYYRQQLVSFAPALVAQIRVIVHKVNFGGYADNGVKPPFWPADTRTLSNPSPWYGPAVISELAAYAPGARR